MNNTFAMDEQLAVMLSQLDYSELPSEDKKDLVSTNKVISSFKKYTDICTKIYPKYLDDNESISMFVYLRENVRWGEGIQTRAGAHTRLALNYNLGSDNIIDTFLKKINSTKPTGNFQLAGIYLNYQRDVKEYTPLHSHEGGFQQVVCLGPTKSKFIVDNKNYILGNADVIVFGREKHGLPKDKACHEERISIDTFYLTL